MKGAGVIKRKKTEAKRTREGGSRREDDRGSARARKLDLKGNGETTDHDAKIKEASERSEKKMSSAEAQWKEAQEKARKLNTPLKKCKSTFWSELEVTITKGQTGMDILGPTMQKIVKWGTVGENRRGILPLDGDIATHGIIGGSVKFPDNLLPQLKYVQPFDDDVTPLMSVAKGKQG